MTKTPAELIKLISVEFEKTNTLYNSLSQTKLQFKFLKNCWNLSIYGSAYFQAAMPFTNNNYQLVHVCVNGNGVHFLNRKTRVGIQFKFKS